jgi:NAD(P)-dependent dehydrogenase (short-subunit alcohol dehydrogenase family)
LHIGSATGVPLVRAELQTRSCIRERSFRSAKEKAKAFGEKMPLARAGQPAELAGAYVLLATGLGSDMTGAVIPVTGGSRMI